MQPPSCEEAWLRGPLAGVHPLLAPVLYSFQQAREDLRRSTAGLGAREAWMRPHGLAPVGFHIRHIAGSVDRLMSYAAGRQLTEPQMEELRAEMEPGADLPALLAHLEDKLSAAERAVRALNPGALEQPREVGRKRLPASVAGLLTHIAEHTQRHVGQAILTAKLVRGG